MKLSFQLFAFQMYMCFKDLPQSIINKILQEDSTNHKLIRPIGQSMNPKILEEMMKIVDEDGTGLFLPAFGACPLGTTAEILKQEIRSSFVLVSVGSPGSHPTAINFMKILAVGTSIRVAIVLYCSNEDGIVCHVKKHVEQIARVMGLSKVVLILYWPADKFDDDRVWSRLETLIGQQHMQYGDDDLRKCICRMWSFPKMIEHGWV